MNPLRRGLVSYWGSLNIQRAKSGEKIFRQTKQISARVVDPTRRIFVKYDGKDSVDSLCDEFLEIPYYTLFQGRHSRRQLVIQVMGQDVDVIL